MPTSRRYLLKLTAAFGGLATAGRALGLPISSRGDNPLILADARGARAAIVLAASPGKWERQAAEDLAFYIERMTGARPSIVDELPQHGAALVLGSAALRLKPALSDTLARVQKANPVLQADAIVVRRVGQRVFVLGSNDESHYFAASWLLQHWGCRWYMPGAFGEHVPRHRVLSVAQLDHAYAPPFEIRHYWLAWNGHPQGAEEFKRRNYMSAASMPGAGQALDRYAAAIAPPGGNHFNVSFSDPATAEHVANQVSADYAAGRDISLAIADGTYSSKDPGDQALITQYDPFMLRPSLTDAMLTLYNAVARILRRKYPSSRSKIGGLAYANVTLPPRIVERVEPNVVMWIAPIDVDPNHAIDDARSPPRGAYGDMVRKWAKVTSGRLAIYDYDQSMLVWRDLPNPSHSVFQRDVKQYRSAGILGIGTESRGAFGTTFLNLFFRGQLMWNPDADVGSLLSSFYDDFYGPAAGPMRGYWSAIFSAWDGTAVTEHEYPVIPAIYTQEVVSLLKRNLGEANALAEGASDLTKERLKFTTHSFEIIESYGAMVTAAARDVDYRSAVRNGERAMASRLELARMNPIFTAHVLGPEAETAEGGAAWLPGEVQQYRELAELTDGPKGKLLKKLPLVWKFARIGGIPPGWTYGGPVGESPASAPKDALTPPASGAAWRDVRADLYLQAQGIVDESPVSALGYYWYQCSVDLSVEEARQPSRLMFPGLFNEAWLFINDRLVGHRSIGEPWWLTDYRFEWDVDVTAFFRPGRNVLSLRGFNPHHFAGMFRRPFLYTPAA